VFCSSVIDYLICIDGASYLNEHSSLIFLYVLMFFEVKKHVFFLFAN